MGYRLIGKIKILLIAVSCLFPLLLSCSIDRPVATQAVDFNRSLELAGNEMILLNIVRSMNYQPMYFSNISQVNTSVSNTLGSTLGVTLPLPFTGSGNADNVTIMPSVTGQTSGGVATATMNSLETDRFIKGMLGPIQPVYVKLFEEQGWPERYLLTMIVQKIRIKEELFDQLKYKFPSLPEPSCCINPVTQQRELCREYDVQRHEDGNPVTVDGLSVPETFVVFYNKPDENFCEIDNFVKFLDVIVDFDFEQITSNSVYGEPFTVSGDSNLADLTLKAKQQNLSLKRIKSNQYVFTEKSTKWRSEVTLRTNQKEVTLKGLIDSEGLVEKSGVQSQINDMFVSDEGRIEVYLKTPQQMLFYLGRIIGIQLANHNSYGNLAKTYWNYEQKPIFVVYETDDEPENSAVKVEYNGKWYSIPLNNQLNRTEISTSTLSFIKQVIGLNTSKEDVESNTGVFTGVVVQ